MSPRDTDRDWTLIAETEPYWGVLSHASFTGAALGKAEREAFFASGAQQIAGLLGFIKHHLQADFQIARALDFGCGVGRLLLPLARVSGEAVGVDVAPAMLAIAAANARAAGLDNVALVLSDDTLSGLSERFDLVNSVIVLQHIPPERGYQLLTRLLSLLAVGGVGSIQLTYAKQRRFMVHEAARAHWFRRDGAMMHDLTPADTGPPEGTITMFDYDLNQVMLLIAAVAGHPVLSLTTEDDGHAGVHFVFRKAREG